RGGGMPARGLVFALLGCSDGASSKILPPLPPVPLPQWHAEPSGISADLYGVWGSAPGDVYAVRTNGTILHTPGWRMSHVVEANFLDVVWGSGAGEVYVGSIVPGRGASAPIFRSTDGGASFAVAAGAGGNTISSLFGTGPSDLWIAVASQNGDLFHSVDGLATVQ